jgi:dienelactone hydrolase
MRGPSQRWTGEKKSDREKLSSPRNVQGGWFIPMDHVDQIKTKLTDEKENFTMEVYPEATHGFFCDERPSYHEASAKDAWEKTKAFFAQHLK